MAQAQGGTTTTLIGDWPEESREAAQLVIDEYGEPDESTPSMLVWTSAPPWKRVVATRTFYRHDFPAPHVDAVESFVDYQVPPSRVTDLAAFDGSVVVERTAGEMSARCHDLQANFLALNLADDIVSGRRSVDDARSYYAKEFLDVRRGLPTPYMQGLRFRPDGGTADPDARAVSDRDLQQATEQGKQSSSR